MTSQDQVITYRYRKDGETYIFRFRPEDASHAIDEVIRLVERDDNSLDWLDGMTISTGISKTLLEQKSR